MSTSQTYLEGILKQKYTSTSYGGLKKVRMSCSQIIIVEMIEKYMRFRDTVLGNCNVDYVVQYFIPTERKPTGRKMFSSIEVTTYRPCTIDNDKENYATMRTVPLFLRAWTGNSQFIKNHGFLSRLFYFMFASRLSVLLLGCRRTVRLLAGLLFLNRLRASAFTEVFFKD